MTRYRRVRGALLTGLSVMSVGFAFAFASPAPAATADLAIFSDDGGRALFGESTKMAPGSTLTRCIDVGVSNAAPQDSVAFTAAASGPLASELRVTVDLGTGGGYSSCAGFTAERQIYDGSLASLSGADALDTGWQPNDNSRQTFRIQVALDPSSSLQGATATGSFTWTATSVGTPTVTPTPVEPTPTTPGEPTTTTPGGSTTPTEPDGSAVPVEGGADGSPQVPGVSPTSGQVVTGSDGRRGEGTGLPAPAPGSEPGAASSSSMSTGTTPPPIEASAAPVGGSSEGDPDVQLDGSWQALDLLRRLWMAIWLTLKSPQYPLLALAATVIFILIQDRIDRRDPKLANATRRQRDNEISFPDIFPKEPA